MWMTVLVSIAVILQSLEFLILQGRGRIEAALPLRGLAAELERASVFRASFWNRLFSPAAFIAAQGIRIALAVLMAVHEAGAGFGSVPVFAPVLAAAQVSLLLTFYSSLRFGGSFNGGSDSMTLIAQSGLVLGAIHPRTGLLWTGCWAAASYFVNGLRKGFHREWWSGKPLAVFAATSPVAMAPVRDFLVRARWMHKTASIAVILFQAAFPLLLFSVPGTRFALGAGVVFHLGNFALFGLNRFFWIWVSSYPAIWHLSEFLRS